LQEIKTTLDTLNSEPTRGSARARCQALSPRAADLTKNSAGKTPTSIECCLINPGATAPRFRVERPFTYLISPQVKLFVQSREAIEVFDRQGAIKN
jgi:hypothetical protein